MEFYVYAYLDPRKPGMYKYGDLSFCYEPIYMGKGKKRRYYQHIINYKKKACKTKRYGIYHKIDEIFTESSLLPTIIKLFNNIKENDAISIEKKLIEQIGRISDNKGPLVNIALGNGGYKSCGYKWSRPMSDQAKEKISDKMKIIYRGVNNPMYGKINECSPNYGRGKKVYQYDIFGNLLKEWKNSNILSKSLNIDRHAIDIRCKESSIKHYKNYLWSYKDTPDSSFVKLSKIERINKMYHVYSFADEFIGSFKDIRNISRCINIPRNVLEYYKRYDFKICCSQLRFES